MAGLTWLHLSDWHQKGPDFDRKVVRDALIRDLRARAKIDATLTQVDFVVFSGDTAFYGKPEEFAAARQNLFDPVLDVLGLLPERLFMVPGNHDLNRNWIDEMLPSGLQKPLESEKANQYWLIDAEKRDRLLEPFKAYRDFVASYTGQPSPAYASIRVWQCGGKQVALLGLNSAWMCARNKDDKGEVNDYGYALLGEPQIHDALKQIENADVRIVVLHHPFDWLAPIDRNRVEPRLGRDCHFILRGHEHQPQIRVIAGTSGDCAIIPAGASYERRIAEDPRYTNAYNFVHLDFDSGQGIVYLQRWSDPRNEWIADTDAHPGGKFTLKTLPKGLGTKTASASPSEPEGDSLSTKELVLERPFHNLPQTNYGDFVGRETELKDLKRLLLPYPKSGHAVITILGVGGVGKSSLALEIAHHYQRSYQNLSPNERFEAIVWFSAKETYLVGNTIRPRWSVQRTLDDLVRQTALVLKRDDILSPPDKTPGSDLMFQALTQQRTLLILDNLETVDDEKLMAFIREPPAPTKIIVTTRHWIDVAYKVDLLGMPPKEARELIDQQCQIGAITLDDDMKALLVKRTGGIPLGIVWSLGLIRGGRPAEKVLLELGNAKSKIAEFCFEASMEAIRGTAAHKMLLALAALENAVTRGTLGNILHAHLSVADQEDGLERLIQLSLANKIADTFSLLPLTRIYALGEASCLYGALREFPAWVQERAMSLELERVLVPYLETLVRYNTDLEPGGIKQTRAQVVLPLDEIYVELRANRDRPDVDRRVMREEVEEIKKRLESENDPKEHERQYQIWAHQARTLEQALDISGSREELSSIVQRHRQVVILGDPGSGKTTLVRHVTLRFARAILAEPDRLFRSQDDLWDENAVWRLPDLGPVRLPILLHISQYAEARLKDPGLSLADYLLHYSAGFPLPYAHELGILLRRLLEAGRCIVLLDGLDEIVDPADRHQIANAIGQFADIYRAAGLPGWLAHSLAYAPEDVEEKLEANAEADEANVVIAWGTNVPEDVRQGWNKRIQQRRREWRRGASTMRLAWELLDEARYAHVGNRIVVTSRIAGYHFAGVPGEFEHYTIRQMSLDSIRLFLEKWCPAVERRISDAPDSVQVEQRARREIRGILQSVETMPGVRRLAENPLLLRILAIIHRNEAHLPQRRVELYETAAITLLRDWHLERGTKEAAIDDVKAMSLLGPVAFEIHENRTSGLISKGETERVLARILARERGEDPEQPSLATREAVLQFLNAIREQSGLFVERGEGLYGFMHLTFEEYFAARYLVSSSVQGRTLILTRLHMPRWREPILLAISLLSRQFYDDTQDLLLAILNAASAYERVLHRDLLFVVDCIIDSVNIPVSFVRDVVQRLLAVYIDRSGLCRYRLLRSSIVERLRALSNNGHDAVVQSAIREMYTECAPAYRTDLAELRRTLGIDDAAGGESLRKDQGEIEVSTMELPQTSSGKKDDKAGLPDISVENTQARVLRILALADSPGDELPIQIPDWLRDDDVEVRQWATLIVARKVEWYRQYAPHLLEELINAAESDDDQLRFRGVTLLNGLSHEMSAVDDSESIGWLVEALSRQYTEGSQVRKALIANYLGGIKHDNPDLITCWLETLAQKDELMRIEARRGLNTVHQASAEVLTLLCATLGDFARPLPLRRAAADVLGKIVRSNANQRANSSIHAALISTLGGPDTDIRRRAAYALQWTTGQSEWTVAQSLLHSAHSDPDSETRVLALRSAGRVLHAVRGFRDLDVSKEALFRWLEAQVKECRSFGRNDATEAVKQLPNLAVLKEAPDAGAVLDALAHPDALVLADGTATQLRGAQEWDKLLESARQEWQFRRYWLETLPRLPAAITQVENLLDAPEPAIRRAAACALACLYHGDDERPARLGEQLPDDGALLQAMLDAITDSEFWAGIDRETIDHPWAVKQIAGWIEERPLEERARFIARMLDDLEWSLVGMGSQGEDDDGQFTDPYIGWPTRRALVAVLAELSERLTYRAFVSQRDLTDVVALFARAGADPDSCNVRRFAIHALGNLQQLTAQVADVFFAACQEVGEVYRETRTVLNKFRVFGPGSLERLTAAIRNPSSTVAYHAALLLGELGLSRSEDLGREGRKRVADELVRMLDDPLSERSVYDFSKDSKGERVGPLYDVIYEALSRVVAGPDAPTLPPAPTQSAGFTTKDVSAEDILAAFSSRTGS